MLKHRQLRCQEEIIAKWKGSLTHPVVSICCLTYNHENYIEDALEGFLIQETDFPFEILIHDDASQDHTQSILRLYEQKYPKILKVIYQNENQYSKSINVGVEFNLKRALGDYVALCEGDDFWLDPKKLQIQKDFLEKNSDYVLCYSDIQPFDENGIINQDFRGARRDLSTLELQKAISIFTPTAFFRNVIQDSPAEFCNAPYGDLTLWSRLGDYGKGKFLSTIKPTMYRVHQTGVHSMQSKANQRKMRLETMMGLYSYRLNRSEHELADFFLEEVVVLALKLQRFGLVKKIILRVVNALVRKISGR